jgi:hypothetical protein
MRHLDQCYQNRTGTGKTGRFDQFTGLTGSNQTFKLLLTGFVRNRPVPTKLVFPVFYFLIFLIIPTVGKVGICKKKIKKKKKKILSQQLLTMKTFLGWIWIPRHIKRMCALMLQLYLCLLDQGNQAKLGIPLLSLPMLRM